MDEHNFFPHLKRNLPRIKEMLGTDDVVIMAINHFPTAHFNTKYKDRNICASGIDAGLSFISTYRLHSGFGAGTGLLLMENWLDRSIRYVVYSNSNWGGTFRYVIIPKGKVFRLIRNCRRQYRMSLGDINAPVLAEHILDTLVTNTIGFLRRHKEFKQYGVNLKRGFILAGPPGNGKTMACRYIQKLCDQHTINYATVLGSDILQAYQKNELLPLFHKATVTFFDDIDISFLNRNSGNGALACSILSCMDGTTVGNACVRIFTTNEPIDKLDEAFIRPGRIDKCINFDRPTGPLRRRLVNEWPDSIKDNIGIDELIDESDGFSFAELELIRTLLVNNYLLENAGWDLDRALDDFRGRKQEHHSKTKFGFAA